MTYCKVALKLLGVKTVCGVNCPMFKNCFVLILEDATDSAIEKVSDAILKIVKTMLKIVKEEK